MNASHSRVATFAIAKSALAMLVATITALPAGKSVLAQHSMFLHAVGLASLQAELQAPSNRRNNRLLRKRLQRKVSVTWGGQELAAAFDRLARTGQVVLWLDRRVDRQQTINAEYVDRSLEQAFKSLANENSLGVVLLDQLVYVGPREAARELETLTQQARESLRDVPASTRRRWFDAQPVSWPRLSEPRVLATDWLTTANIELLGGERIAHDLWPAQSLPALPLVDRLVLLLTGFDLTCKISSSGKACEVVPIQRPLRLTRPLSESRPERGPRQRKEGQQPKSQPQVTRKRRAPQRKATSRGAKPDSSHQRFSLRLVNQPLGPVLDKLAQQLKLEVSWQGADSSQEVLLRKQLVSCDVQNVDLDELLRSVLAAVGVRHGLEGNKVTLQLEQ